jgi:hypothetical protein
MSNVQGEGLSSEQREAGSLGGRSWSTTRVQPRRHRETLVRGLFILLFLWIYGLTQGVLTAIAVVQFVYSLLAGRPNVVLMRLGEQLGVYALRIVSFVTYASEARPFPFATWPGGPSRNLTHRRA